MFFICSEPAQSLTTMSPTAQPTPYPDPSKVYEPWISPSSVLPYGADIDSATAYSELSNTIWILGGYAHQGQLVGFNVSSQSFTGFGVNAYSAELHSYGTQATQIGDYLYIIDGNAGRQALHRFNVNTTAMDYDYATLDFGVDNQACLASSDQDDGYLFLLHGTSVAMMNVSDSSWTTLPSMNTARYRFPCIVSENQQLFAMDWGIEALDVSDMQNVQNQAWTELDDTSPFTRMEQGMAVLDGSDILIIGSRDAGAGTNYNGSVFVIDTLSNTFSLGGTMDEYVTGTANIIVDGVVYAFGGEDDSGYVDSWRY